MSLYAPGVARRAHEPPLTSTHRLAVPAAGAFGAGLGLGFGFGFGVTFGFGFGAAAAVHLLVVIQPVASARLETLPAASTASSAKRYRLPQARPR